MLVLKETVINRIDFLYTNIGRGHPYYLDGIIEALVRRGRIKIMRGEADVFGLSRGIARFGWKTTRWLYNHSTSNNFMDRLYSLARTHNNNNHPGRLHRLMGRDIVYKYRLSDDPLIVAHPMLVGILKNKANLIYQHGEIVVPDTALVIGADTVFVPLKSNADRFGEIGYENNQLVVTGLCIEPAIVKQAGDAFKNRQEHLERDQVLTGAFFSSGAEPITHIKKILAAALSVVHNGGRVVIFAKEGGRLNESARHLFKRNQLLLNTINSGDLFTDDLPRALMINYRSRREETAFTAKFFKYFDYFMAPSHERTNWALGLGLPMFIAGPPIGPFAPLNEALLVDSGVGMVIEDNMHARSFGMEIKKLHAKGKLAEMSRAGWRKYDIHGFEKIADWLVERYRPELQS